MSVFGDPKVATQAEVDALKAQIGTTPQFVQAGSMTVDELLAAYPAGAGYRGRYARVTDYGGGIDRVLRCDFDSNSGLYFWSPTLADYGRSMPVTGNMSLPRLKTPPTLILTGSIALGVTRNVTLDTANGRPGEIQEIKGGLTSLLGTLNLLGTGLGSGVGLLLGAYQKFVLDWQGGQLTWVRLV